MEAIIIFEIFNKFDTIQRIGFEFEIFRIFDRKKKCKKKILKEITIVPEIFIKSNTI